ncbi:MAG: choice-of-anchor Q domain-containing protein [Lysobacterales bacterium]
MLQSRALSLAIASLLIAGGARAASLTVTNAGDNTADDGLCTLREAIDNANNDSQNGRTSPGECAAGNGADLITFDPGAFAGTQTLTLSGGHLAITSPLTITGTSRDRLIIDANATSRHFLIDDGSAGTVSAVAISDLSLRNGRVSADDGGSILATEPLSLARVTLDGNVAVSVGTRSARGGGLAVLSAAGSAGLTVSLDSVVLSGNQGGTGGALALVLSDTLESSTVTLQNCLILDNEVRRNGSPIAARVGGGFIDMGSGSLLIQDSTISANRSEADIGGLALSVAGGGSIAVRRTQILNNTAGAFGGSQGVGGLALNAHALSYSGPAPAFNVEVSDSTIAGNTATQNNGGAVFEAQGPGPFVIERSTIWNNLAQGVAGGGLAGGLNLSALDAAITLRDSTVSGNTANGNGGGVYAYAYSDTGIGRVSIENTTITGNSADANADGNGRGGGIALDSSSNMGAQFAVSGSVIAGNLDGNPATPSPDVFRDSFLIAFSDSLIGGNTGSGLPEAPLGSPDGNNNLFGSAAGAGVIDARLGLLGDNGGRTFTHYPASDSPLIDRYTGCNGNDQTGRARGVDSDGLPDNDCDIGAVESTPVIFGNGFESSAALKNRDPRSLLLSRPELQARLSGHDAPLLLLAESTDASGGMVLVHARLNGERIEWLLDHYQDGQWTEGRWLPLTDETMQLRW